MNFDYSYNIQRPIFKSKQVAMDKEEVVEKSVSENRADVPKAEVITEDANVILGDINRAMIAGVNAVQKPNTKEDRSWLETYYARKDYWNQNNANMTNVEKISCLKELMDLIYQCNNLNLSNSVQEVLRNDLVQWHQLSNNIIGDTSIPATQESITEYAQVLCYGGLGVNYPYQFKTAFSMLQNSPNECVAFFRDKVASLQNASDLLNSFIDTVNANFPNATFPNSPTLLVTALQDILSVVQEELTSAQRHLEQAQLLCAEENVPADNGPAIQ